MLLVIIVGTTTLPRATSAFVPLGTPRSQVRRGTPSPRYLRVTACRPLPRRSARSRPVTISCNRWDRSPRRDAAMFVLYGFIVAGRVLYAARGCDRNESGCDHAVGARGIVFRLAALFSSTPAGGGRVTLALWLFQRFRMSGRRRRVLLGRTAAAIARSPRCRGASDSSTRWCTHPRHRVDRTIAPTLASALALRWCAPH